MIIVGLGNPGTRYDGTRHNVGREVVTGLAETWNLSFGRKERFGAVSAEGQVAGRRCQLLVPQTFMNRSGDAVGPFAGFHKVPPAEVLVVHDDMDIPVGEVRVKQGGGHGGHNGIRDIIRGLGTSEFGRIRFGVGRPPAGVDPAAFVLMRWRPDEQETVQEGRHRAVQAIEQVLRDGMTKAMNEFNVRTTRKSDNKEKEVTE